LNTSAAAPGGDSNIALRSSGSRSAARATMGERTYCDTSGELDSDATCTWHELGFSSSEAIALAFSARFCVSYLME